MKQRPEEVTSDLDERLSAYLDHELAGPARRWLEDAMRRDPSLIDTLERFQAVSGVLRLEPQDERVVPGVKAAVRQARARAFRRRRWWWGGAPAGALALLLVGVVLWPGQRATVTAQDLYVQYDVAISGLGGP